MVLLNLRSLQWRGGEALRHRIRRFAGDANKGPSNYGRGDVGRSFDCGNQSDHESVAPRCQITSVPVGGDDARLRKGDCECPSGMMKALVGRDGGPMGVAVI